MNVRITVFSLLALALAGMPVTPPFIEFLNFYSSNHTASAAPNPSPIDAGTANVIAVNDNLACSSGSCNSSVSLYTNI